MEQQTLVSIANLALDEIGGDYVLASLEDNTKEGRLCNKHIHASRRTLLSMHPWKFAKAMVTLAPLANSYGLVVTNCPDPVTGLIVVPPNAIPPFGPYQFAYALPSDCLQVRWVNDYDTRWEVAGPNVITSFSSIDLTYTADIKDASQFASQFCDALAMHLASKIAYAITHSEGIKKAMTDKFMTVIRKARHSDAIEQSPQHLIADLYDEVRLGPNRGFVRDPMT